MSERKDLIAYILDSLKKFIQEFEMNDKFVPKKEATSKLRRLVKFIEKEERKNK